MESSARSRHPDLSGMMEAVVYRDIFWLPVRGVFLPGRKYFS
jgi:hypothetical protein